MSLVCVPTPTANNNKILHHQRVASGPPPSTNPTSTDTRHTKSISTSASLEEHLSTTNTTTNTTTNSDQSANDRTNGNLSLSEKDDEEEEVSLYFDPYDGESCSPLWPHYYVRRSSITTNTATTSLGLADPVSLSRDVW